MWWIKEWMEGHNIKKNMLHLTIYFEDLAITVFALLTWAGAFKKEAEMKSAIFQILVFHNADGEKRKGWQKEIEIKTVIRDSWLEQGLGRRSRRCTRINWGECSKFPDLQMPPSAPREDWDNNEWINNWWGTWRMEGLRFGTKVQGTGTGSQWGWLAKSGDVFDCHNLGQSVNGI